MREGVGSQNTYALMTLIRIGCCRFSIGVNDRLLYAVNLPKVVVILDKSNCSIGSPP